MGYRQAILNDQSNKKKALPVVTGRTAVGVTGIEPMASPTRTERATKLRHTPKTIQRRRSASDSGIIGYAAKFASEINMESLVGDNSRAGPLPRCMAFKPAGFLDLHLHTGLHVETCRVFRPSFAH